MKRVESEGNRRSAPTRTSGVLRRTASDRYQTGSERSAPRDEGAEVGSDGYQTASEEPSTSEQPPHPDSRPGEDDPESGGIDPFEAFAQVAAEAADERRRQKERRDPAIWLPGPDDLDQELGSPDRETRFSRDSWSRGNPQVSVRLRPLDFDRLRRAADLYGVRPTTLARMMIIRGIRAILDAELERSGELLRDRGRH
jgi:hypothetical protein